jgi:hypothetical protein
LNLAQKRVLQQVRHRQSVLHKAMLINRYQTLQVVVHSSINQQFKHFGIADDITRRAVGKTCGLSPKVVAWLYTSVVRHAGMVTESGAEKCSENVANLTFVHKTRSETGGYYTARKWMLLYAEL